MIVGHPGQWQQFMTRSDNRGLSIMEMKQKYLKEQLMFEQSMSFQIQQQAKLAQQAASGGKKRITDAQGCIEFVAEVTYNTNFSFEVTTSEDTTYTINWGDGVTEEGSLSAGATDLNHDYPENTPATTVRLCFANPSAVTQLEFYGND